MTRKLVFVLAIAAAIGVTTGCKEDRPTQADDDPKARYGKPPQYKGTTQGTPQGSDGTKGTTTP